MDIGSSNPDPEMTKGIDWLQCHQYRHIEYAQTARDFIRTSNGRTFQNRKLTFPHGSIVYSQEIKDVFSVQPPCIEYQRIAYDIFSQGVYKTKICQNTAYHKVSSKKYHLTAVSCPDCRLSVNLEKTINP